MCRYLLVVTVTVLAIGCGAAPTPLIPVKGVVTYDGKPLTTGTVLFRPDSARGNSGAEVVGTIDENGTYVLRTGTGPQAREGAAPGWYKVGVVAVREPDATAKRVGGLPPARVPLIPLKYADAANSGLAVEVVESPAEGAYDLKLRGDAK
jgi:hypothetical protein